MIVYVDSATGAILSAIAAASNPGTYPKNPGSPLYLDDATYADVWDHPAWYLIQDSLPVAQAAWSVTAPESTTTPGEYTVTATLVNPPSRPPSAATFTVAGQTFTSAITSNQTTWTLAVHPLLGNQRVSIQVSASGTVSGSAGIGASPALIGQDVQTLSGVPTVVPSGAGSLNYVLQATANTVPQGFALANIQSALLPNIPFTLGNIVPASDAPIPVWAQLLATLTAFQTASTTANEALNILTNLE